MLKLLAQTQKNKESNSSLFASLRLRGHLILLASFVVGCGWAASSQDGWDYLDNGTVRIGVDLSRGACIGFFGESKTGRNLLNHHDEGRFIQQSYYGAKDDSDWHGKPWVYNPIQGGSYKRVPAIVHEFKKTPNKLYAKIEPRHWATGRLCPEMVMAQKIALGGSIAKISFAMKYDGPDQGKPRSQEMPAVFVDAALGNFYYTKAGTLVSEEPCVLIKREKSKEGLKEGDSTSEWVAYVDDNNWGIGIYTPGTTRFTLYVTKGNGKTGPSESACSYVSPLRHFSLKTGMQINYDVYLTIGTIDEIKTRFESLKNREGSR